MHMHFFCFQSDEISLYAAEAGTNALIAFSKNSDQS